MNKSEPELASIALHEIGHAFLATRLGLLVTSVELGHPTGRALGRCQYLILDTPDRPMRLLIVALAGGIAVSHAGYEPVGLDDDESTVQELLDLLAPGDQVRQVDYRLRAERLAQVQIKKHWPVITALTARLIRCGKLTGEELLAAIEESKAAA